MFPGQNATNFSCQSITIGVTIIERSLYTFAFDFRCSRLSRLIYQPGLHSLTTAGNQADSVLSGSLGQIKLELPPR